MRGCAPVPANGHVQANFPPEADPVRDNGPALAGLAQDNGRRAAGRGQRSDLPAGEAD